MRLALLLLLGGCFGDALELDATSTSDDLDVQTHAQYTLCEGAPCTSISVEIRRSDDTGSRYAPDAAARVSIDGQPAFDLTFKPYVSIDNGGEFVATVDGWINSLELDATAGADRATMTSTSPITTPDEANVELPDVITLGGSYTMQWNHQEHARASVLFATNAPALRFGFLMAQKQDSGSLKLETELLNPAGIYTIALYREITLDHDQLVMIWGSNWQKKVTVKNVPVD
jgi:hypothetical protein